MLLLLPPLLLPTLLLPTLPPTLLRPAFPTRAAAAMISTIATATTAPVAAQITLCGVRAINVNVVAVPPRSVVPPLRFLLPLLPPTTLLLLLLLLLPLLSRLLLPLLPSLAASATRIGATHITFCRVRPIDVNVKIPPTSSIASTSITSLTVTVIVASPSDVPERSLLSARYRCRRQGFTGHRGPPLNRAARVLVDKPFLIGSIGRMMGNIIRRLMGRPLPSFPARPTTRFTSGAVAPPPLPPLPPMFPVICAHRVLPPPPLRWLLQLVLAVLLVLPSCWPRW
jgi:hypothetical protein